MKWMDYIYLVFFVVAVIILIMQIAGMYLTKKQSKLEISNAKFKLDEIVYATYEELKKLAVENFAKELDDDYARL